MALGGGCKRRGRRDRVIQSLPERRGAGKIKDRYVEVTENFKPEEIQRYIYIFKSCEPLTVKQIFSNQRKCSKIHRILLLVECVLCGGCCSAL